MANAASARMAKVLSRLFLATVVAVSVCLTGCGGSTSGADGADSGSSTASVSDFSFDLSGYESLETNSVVILLADGTTERYTPESAGQYYNNDGVSEAFFTVNDAFDDNTAKAKARYENAVIVIKAPITIIDDTRYVILDPNSGSWFGFGSLRSSDPAGEDVTFPMAFVRNSEPTILELALDKGDVVLIAAPLSIVQDGTLDYRAFVLGDGHVIEAA